MAGNGITVVEALGLTFSEPELTVGETATYSVAGAVTITSPSLGALTQQFTINGATHQMVVGGVPITTLYDLFPVTVSELGELELSFGTPVSLAISGMYLAPLSLTTYKTDKATVIKHGPNSNNPPPRTSAQAMALIGAADPSLPGKITEVSPPNVDTWCHGWVFLPPGTIGGIIGEDVDTILLENNYYFTDIPWVVAPGDVVVYRNASGKVLHSGIVVAVDPATNTVTKIRSKWGAWGVYEHAPTDVLPNYKPSGGTIRCWKSNRTGGHTLKDP